MMLWYFVRSCFLWMPFPLFTLCSLVFVAFVALFVLKLIRFVVDFLPFIF